MNPHHTMSAPGSVGQPDFPANAIGTCTLEVEAHRPSVEGATLVREYREHPHFDLIVALVAKEWTRTTDFQLMRLASYLCSTPQCKWHIFTANMPVAFHLFVPALHRAQQ